MARETRDETRSTREQTQQGRTARVPLGVPRTKLAFAQRPGYVRRVVTDTEGRLQNAEAGGYQFVKANGAASLGDADIDNVNRDLGTCVSRVVNKSTGEKGYLMEIKEEFYKEDQAAKAAKLDEVDRAIRRGTLAKDGEERYVPDHGRGIDISRL